jgi:beta-lactamase class A
MKLICLTLAMFLYANSLSGTGPVLTSPATSVRAVTSDLQKRIEQLINASGAEAVAVAYHNLATGREILINPDLAFHAASTMKVPVMMEIFRQVDAGKLSLDELITVKNEFKSIVDGSAYSLTPDEDSDQSLYKRIGQSAAVRELLQMMITVSSNLATNILIERAGADRVTKLMRDYGANDIVVLRGVEDGKAYERGLNNKTTARDLMTILTRIAEGRAVSAAASEEMIKVLLDQKLNEGIPSRLPPGIRVAHKTGSITALYHDAGIVYPPGAKPFVLVVLTRGLKDETRAHALVSEIASTVFRSSQSTH